MRTEEPHAIALKDYHAPDYRITTIELDFALEPLAIRVTATSKVTRTGEAAPLVLDGEQIKLVSVAIDGRALDNSAFSVSDERLTIHALPANFTLWLAGVAPVANRLVV